MLDRELSAEALREQLRLSPSALSQQMAELRRLGLVRVRYDNNTVYYSSDHQRARELLVMLDSRIWKGSLEPKEVSLPGRSDGSLFVEVEENRLSGR